MDMSQYLQLFIEESQEHLQNLNRHLLELEKEPENLAIVNEIFRVAHTLKGMAGTMGFNKVSTLTHDMENVLQEIRSGKMAINSKIVDVLFQCLDILENYVESIVNSGSEGDKDSHEVIVLLNNILNSPLEAPKPSEIQHSQQNLQDQEDAGVAIDEYSQNIINKAVEMGLHAFTIYIKLSEACVLKSARAFIIFKTLEKFSDIIKSEPKVQDIEDEKFDFEFTVAVVSKHPRDILFKELDSIAEISQINIKEISSKQATQEVTIKPEIKTNESIAASITEQLQQKKEEVQSGGEQISRPKTGKTVRVDIDRLDHLMNLVSELIIIKTQLEDIKETNSQNYSETVDYLERISTSIHDAVMKVRMVPVEVVFNRFPRMIRDLSKELNKEIALNMFGAKTEVDRTVIDEIGDPLIHLLRNSADHGIETPDKRRSNNKPVEGTINLIAYHDGNDVVIEVQDDGDGIDVERVKKKAIDRGLVAEEIADSLTQKEITDFLFRPSFSTADKVTDISGRGVGLDVVKTKIESLGGTVEVETAKGKGTTFIIRLPLTLAIIQGLMVLLGNEKYAIPLSSIKEIINIQPEEIKQVQNQEVFLLRNNVIPIVRLSQVLEVPAVAMKPKKYTTVVVVKKGEKLFGLVVDRLLGQQEIVIKSMNSHLSHIKGFVGATILGDGQVALILDISSLVF